MIMPELTEQASSEESLPETGMIGASDLFPVSTTANEESDRPLVIALYSSVGSGHRSAAASTAEAFARLRGNHPLVPEDADIELLDILDFGYMKFDGEKTTTLFTGPTRYIYDITWHYVLTGRLLWGGGSIWSYFMYSAFTRYVAKRKPIAIVTTHIVAANAAVAARMITKFDFPVVCVPTDYGVEGLWPHRFSDLFCVADELMKEELYPRKVKPEDIKVTAFPLSRASIRSTIALLSLKNMGYLWIRRSYSLSQVLVCASPMCSFVSSWMRSSKTLPRSMICISFS